MHMIGRGSCIVCESMKLSNTNPTHNMTGFTNSGSSLAVIFSLIFPFLPSHLPPLLPSPSVSESLRCYCSDCNLNQFCYGDICYTQIFLDVQSGVVSERWRCLNTTRLCDISTVITAYACCNTHDMCNRNLHATLGGNSEEERTSNLTNKTSNLNNRTSNLNTTMCTNLTEIANSTMGQNESIVFENSTLQCNETSRNETTPSRNETTPPLSETTPTTIEIESFTPSELFEG